MKKIIDYYYKFDRNVKTFKRFDLVAKSGCYSPLEEHNKKGEIFIYCVRTDDMRHIKKKSDFALTSRSSKYLSGLFFPEIQKPNLAYGDMLYTHDLLLVNLMDNSLEIFVCKDMLQFKDMILQMFVSGDLDEIIEEFRRN